MTPESHRCAIAVMAKAPLRGAVKSRLVPPLTKDEAAALNRCFIRDVCASIDAAAEMVASQQAVTITGLIAYTPAGTEAAFDGAVPTSFEFIAQRGEDLGARLINVASDLLSAGFDSVALMNSDSPTIPGSLISSAITSLARSGDRVAIVGADDGGYCLIGLKQPHWRIFEDIAWSTDAVFAQTVDRVGELGLEIARMPSWYDIDDAASLRRLANELFAHRICGAAAGSPNERAGLPGELTGSAALATRAWMIGALSGSLAARLGMTATD